MLPCEKRQKVITRSKDGSTTTRYRCLNAECGQHRQDVDEDACAHCPTRVVRHEGGDCSSTLRERMDEIASHQQAVTTEEFLETTKEEVFELMEAAGMDADDLVEEGGTNYPPLTLQFWTYKEALIRWNKAGRPTRSQEEVQKLHKICAGDSTTQMPKCDWFDPDKNRCKGCGCKVTVGSLAVFNKLKMATEKCPMGKF